MDPSCRHLGGKVVGITGATMPDPSDGPFSRMLKRVSESRTNGFPRPMDPGNLEEVLMACDIVIPGWGDSLSIG